MKRLVINGLLVACSVSFCYLLGCLCHSLLGPFVSDNNSIATSESPSLIQQHACAEKDLAGLLEGFGIEFEAGASVADRLAAIRDLQRRLRLRHLAPQVSFLGS
jgi:hypothetical protein